MLHDINGAGGDNQQGVCSHDARPLRSDIHQPRGGCRRRGATTRQRVVPSAHDAAQIQCRSVQRLNEFPTHFPLKEQIITYLCGKSSKPTSDEVLYIGRRAFGRPPCIRTDCSNHAHRQICGNSISWRRPHGGRSRMRAGNPLSRDGFHGIQRRCCAICPDCIQHEARAQNHRRLPVPMCSCLSTIRASTSNSQPMPTTWHPGNLLYIAEGMGMERMESKRDTPPGRQDVLHTPIRACILPRPPQLRSHIRRQSVGKGGR